MDIISIKNLSVFAYHGVMPEENVVGQKFDISVDMYVDNSAAANDDDISKSVSYADVCQTIKEYSQNNTFNLIETLAERLAERLLLEYNDIENKYYLNEIAYKVIQFEHKYRDFAEQLPVIMKGMQCYGYEISAMDLQDTNIEDSEVFGNMKDMIKLSRDEQLELNTRHCEELIDMMSDDRLALYKEVMRGAFEIKKGDKWKDDLNNHKMIVKNIEVFEKIVPLFLSLSKQYEIPEIKSIFEYCRNQNKTFNFAAIGRIRTLTNILYND